MFSSAVGAGEGATLVIQGWERLPAFAADGALLDALVALAARGAWTGGRQGTGYEKAALPPASELSAAVVRLLERAQAAVDPGGRAAHRQDAWLLRYPRGASVPRHVDPPLDGGLAHVRLNLLVRAPERGGLLRCDGTEVALTAGDAVLFRPDVVVHEVSAVEVGTRLVLSVGANVPV